MEELARCTVPARPSRPDLGDRPDTPEESAATGLRRKWVIRKAGRVSGLFFDGSDYTRISHVVDTSQARNVIDVRSAPDETRIVTATDDRSIKRQAELSGHTGRIEGVSDSREGNDVGRERAEQSAQAELRRFPVVHRFEIQSIDSTHLIDSNKQRVMSQLRGGEIVFCTGTWLPDMPEITTTLIDSETLYCEPSNPDDAIPVEVEVGKLIRLGGSRRRFDNFTWNGDVFRWEGMRSSGHRSKDREKAATFLR